MLILTFAAAVSLVPSQKIRGDVTYRIGAERWRIVRSVVSDVDWTHRVDVYRDGKRVLRKSGDSLYDAVALKWPFKGTLLAVSRHSPAGHGIRTRLYRADGNRLTDLQTELVSEVGGPVYRDLDHDGRPEVLFDNNDWYELRGKPPTLLYTYKYDGKRLRLWRKLPNHEHRNLPYRLPYF